MKRTIAVVLCVMLVACTTTGGRILPDGQSAMPDGKAVIAFSVRVTDGTPYDNCSVFVGRNPATARWFAWPVKADAVAMIALEIDPGDFGFHRFGCMFRSLQLTTSVTGPQITVAPGEARYLGRLTVSDTEMGSAAGYSRMPTSVRLDFEDQRVEDFDALGRKWPLFRNEAPDVAVPPGWGSHERYQLRPYKDGVKLIAAPVL